MKIWNSYYLASSVKDALHALGDSSGQARFIAGGTDLLLDLQQGRQPPVEKLVDVSGIPELNCIEVRHGYLFVGAAVALNKVVASPLVQQHALGLVEACQLIGGPQVRNTATLGGNVAHALPAGDGTIALVSLGAEAEVAGLPGGVTRHPMLELFSGPGRSALEPKGQLLVGFYIPLRDAGEGSAFRRVMRPQGVAIAILNMGIWLRREAGTLADVRIALGPAGPVPLRAYGAEAALRGLAPARENQRKALEALLAEARFRTSPHRATSAYRVHMAEVLLEDTLQAAWQRASGDL